MALPSMFSVLIQKSTPIVGIPAEVNTPSVYRLTILVLPTPASPTGKRVTYLPLELHAHCEDAIASTCVCTYTTTEFTFCALTPVWTNQLKRS